MANLQKILWLKSLECSLCILKSELTREKSCLINLLNSLKKAVEYHQIGPVVWQKINGRREITVLKFLVVSGISH